ncbi:MFS transporter [Streptococcus macacae]|uniref:Drug resistance MFS transporter, drug:H+ antiporter-2 family n=1 Tax=Streptococcus macacae NCTC 11558 TaxID=764298 RepID=G5JZ47_9STRE|nr:DHA2 family efflux MFS transporter permease subunit [Streptococcus macacae]EHJ51603.1 drug resistance MFS transporter, drug:H+ antiporter-2 family [Streptococcus macacae NCTC 11558]SUN78300.1 MDR permease [Streptococcus macacae NCTC 11558]
MLKKILLTFAMCLGIFLVMLDTTIMNIALPAIKDGISVSTDKLSWALNAYTIVFATFTIPLSRLADIYGRKKLLVIAFILFGLGSLLSGLSNGFYQLIAGRIIASLGASILLPVGNALGISTWSVEDRFKVVAALGLTQGGAAAIGPTLGGIITDNLSWNWIFLINIPIALIAIILLTMSYASAEEVLNRKIDWLGSLISMMGLFATALGLIKYREWGVSDAKTLICLAVAIVSVVIFIGVEKHINYPMIDLALFKKKVFTVSSLIAFIAQFFYIGVIVILPTFFTLVQGKNELDAALILLPMSITVFLFGGLGSLVINKLGPRLLVFIGLLSILVSYYLLTNCDSGKVSAIILSTFILGIGFGIIAGPINVLAASDFSGGMLTASQSVISVIRQIGSVFGVSVFMSMMTSNLKNLSIHDFSHLSNAYLSIYKPWLLPLLLLLMLTFLFPKKENYLEN